MSAGCGGDPVGGPNVDSDMTRYLTPIASALIAAAIVGCVRPAAAHAERAIGPAVLSLPELASQLSRSGETVHCARELRSRAAFVSLGTRPLAEQRELLSAGLGVRFRREGSDWLLEWDPDLRRKERSRLSRYAELARNRVREQVASVIGKYRGRTREQFLEEIERLQEDGRVEGLGGFLGADGPDRATALDFLPSEREQQVSQLRAISSPAGWKMVQLLAAAPSFDLWLRRGGELRAGFEDDPLDIERYSPLTPDPIYNRAHGMIQHDLLLLGVWFDPIHRTLNVGARYSSATTVDDDARTDVEIAFEPDLPDLFSELGRQDAADRAADIAATQHFLQSARAATPVALESPGGADCASQFVQEWSRATQQEAVMLLWPEREQGLTQPSGSRFSLAEWFAQDARSRAADHWMTRGFGWRPTQRQLTEVVSRALHSNPLEQSPWSLKEQDGVLLVTNQLAFLDRENDFPLAELLPVMRSARWEDVRSSQRKDPSIPYDVLARYANSLSPERNAAWWRLGYANYRGLPLRGLATTAAFVPLVEHLDLARRNMARRRIRSGQTLELPLARCSRWDLDRLQSSLRAFGLEYPECWHPGFVRERSALALEVQSKPADGSASAEVWFELHDLPVPDRPNDEWIHRVMLQGGGLRVH